MTREEEIIETAKFIYSPSSGIPQSLPMRVGFIEGAKWADKTMIEKAKKWLENFLEKTIQKPSINDGYTSDTITCADYKRHRLIEEVLYDFKKAMEEQS
jgi:hypothetical protein